MAKLQSAMEYLMTYSWAILIIAVILIALFALGIFSPNTVVSTQCFLPAGLSCINIFMISNGLITVTLLQETATPINITAYGCNANNTVKNMVRPFTASNQVRMQIGANYTFNVQCWGGTSVLFNQPGTSFRGWLFINYTETTSGFPHTAPGEVLAKIT